MTEPSELERLAIQSIVETVAPSIQYGVITHISPNGNYAAATNLRIREGNGPYLAPDDELNVRLFLQLGSPVFSLGEILVLDETGREHAGLMRKPSKWNVTYELFYDVAMAVQRAREVSGPWT